MQMKLVHTHLALLIILFLVFSSLESSYSPFSYGNIKILFFSFGIHLEAINIRVQIMYRMSHCKLGNMVDFCV